MRKFTFELDRVLRLAQISEEQHRAALIRADGHYHLARDTAQGRATNVAEFKWGCLSSNADLQQMANAQLILIEASNFSNAKESLAFEQARVKKEEWVEKKSAYESLLRLRDRRYQEFCHELDLNEQKDNDEVGSNIWRRTVGHVVP